MALLKSEVQRITFSIPKDLLKDLDEHIKHFAFGVRSQWLTEAIREKLGREKTFIMSREKENDDE